MRLRRTVRQNPHLDLTSLIDVVFLLLIFFMVSTTFTQEADLKLTLPKSGAKPATTPEAERIEITVQASGDYYVNGTATSREALGQTISKLSGGRTDLPTIIKADGQARHQDVVFALDLLTQLDMHRVGIATLNK